MTHTNEKGENHRAGGHGMDAALAEFIADERG